MDVANELLDAIEIIVDKKIRENTAQIYFGVCKSVSGDSCVMSINGRNNTIHFYGSAPIVGLTYRVFVPNGNMSMAFAITGNDDRKGLYYSNPNLLDNWYFGNPVNQRGQTSYTGGGYGIDRWKMQVGTIVLNDNYISLIAPSSSAYAQLRQWHEANDLVGKKATFSVLTDNGLRSTTLTIGTSKYVTFDDCVLYHTTSSGSIVYEIRSIDGTTVNLIAAKLELGDQQTLAHQENGVWVLNEIPDYGEQLARCQRYALALSNQSGHSIYGSGMINSGQNARIVVPLPATMRTKPTVSVTGDLEIIANGSTYAVTSVSVETLSPSAVCLLVNSASLSTAQAAAPALLRSYGGGKGELFLSADL